MRVREFDEELKRLKEKGLFRKPIYHGPAIRSGLSPGKAKISINGRVFINFSSNNYLGLSEHPGILKACASALRLYGLGSGASRLLSGSCIPHKKLEERIAVFKNTQSALVFNTGYAANTGIIQALAKSESTVFSDELNHASIVDGIKLSKAKIKIYRHRDVNHLESLLKKSSPSKGRSAGQKLIITDTVFSMDGDIAPLKDIVFLSRKFNAMLMIDDAHGTGVLGKTGRGGLEHFGINAGEIIQMGTLSKAFGCFGGFVAGSGNLVSFLINRARSFIYSTSLPPALAEACIRAIDIVDSSSLGLRKRLWKNRQRLYLGIRNLGYDTLDSETPIIPLFAGGTKTALKIGSYLYRKKIFAPAIRPPAVPEGKCRIRFSVTAAHTDEDIDSVLESLKKYKGFR